DGEALAAGPRLLRPDRAARRADARRLPLAPRQDGLVAAAALRLDDVHGPARRLAPEVDPLVALRRPAGRSALPAHPGADPEAVRRGGPAGGGRQRRPRSLLPHRGAHALGPAGAVLRLPGRRAQRAWAGPR